MKDIEKLLKVENLTSRQKEVLETIKETGSVKKASKVLKVGTRGIYEILSKVKKKHLAQNLDELVPDNQKLFGTTTLYKTNEDGEKVESIQWVKTEKSKLDTLEMLKEVTESFASTIEPTRKTKAPKITSKELLTTYVMTDLHLGQYSWKEESGVDVDIHSVYQNTLTATEMLFETTPKSKQAIILDLGDTLHASNDAARTKSGHELDTDSRHAKVFRMLVDLKIKMIDSALQKHEKVHYVIVSGNHSDLVSNYIIAMLSAYYRDEPRFSVNESPALHKYFRFGKTLLGFHHGHATKMNRLPEVMVWDRKEDISVTDYRYWLTGHVHKDTVVDNPICRMESFRNLTSNDAWAQGAGYRGIKQMTAITYSDKYGEVARNIVNLNSVLDEINK